MAHVTPLWPIWQSLLSSFAWAFTRPGFRRFAEWVSALAINPEEHTITQSVTAIERVADWKALETLAEDGAWRAGYVTDALTRLVEKAPGRLWHGDHVSAVDDTKVHRSGEHVWGTCTFHEYTARCPNRATTVRAHNWVVCGVLLRNPEQPAWFLPLSGRLSFRKSQWPVRSGVAGPKEAFRTKCALAVDLIREQARTVGGRHLTVVDGGSALRSVVRPLVAPRGRPPPGRVPDAAAARRPAPRPAAVGAAPGAAGAEAEVGQEAAAAPPRRALDPVVAGGACLHRRPAAEGALVRACAEITFTISWIAARSCSSNRRGTRAVAVAVPRAPRH